MYYSYSVCSLYTCIYTANITHLSFGMYGVFRDTEHERRWTSEDEASRMGQHRQQDKPLPNVRVKCRETAKHPKCTTQNSWTRDRNLLLGASFKQAPSLKVNLQIWEMMVSQNFKTFDSENMEAPSHCWEVCYIILGLSFDAAYRTQRFITVTKKSSHCNRANQIIQPTRCNSFTSLLLDVYVWLNMFLASPRPSSGAYNCIRSLWFYRWKEAAGVSLVVVCQTTTNNTLATSLQ